MADPYNRKPEPLDDDDDGLYELAEDPDTVRTPNVPPPPGIMPGNVDVGPGTPPARGQAAGNDRLDPMLDEPKPSREMKTGSGGKGAASHFSGEDPEYVNPEIARMRREEARIARAAEEAEEAARKQKITLIVVGVLVVLAIVAYFLLL